MILWTIQHKAAYDAMLESGVLRADEQPLFCQDDFRFTYDWMAEQMCRRVRAPPAGVSYPVWAWYQWEGVRKRLDMRTHRRWTTKGTPIVLLTINVPDELVLLSDFDTWHIILNDGYLPLWKHDDREEYTEEEKIRSWENVFCWKESTDLWDAPKTTQATFWELKREWVIKAEHYISG